VKLSSAELHALRDCILTPRQRQIVEMRLSQMRFSLIAKRLGVTCGTVTSAMAAARKRLTAIPGTGGGKPVNSPIDQAWHERQVAYVRSIEGEHRTRYLRGIAIAHGQDVADEVESCV
jgi:DNA-binding CsgD family transcriptional regulator